MSPATSVFKMRRNFKKKITRRYSLIKSNTITKLCVFSRYWQIKTTILSQNGNPSWAPPNPPATWTNPVFDLTHPAAVHGMLVQRYQSQSWWQNHCFVTMILCEWMSICLCYLFSVGTFSIMKEQTIVANRVEMMSFVDEPKITVLGLNSMWVVCSLYLSSCILFCVMLCMGPLYSFGWLILILCKAYHCKIFCCVFVRNGKSISRFIENSFRTTLV